MEIQVPLPLILGKSFKIKYFKNYAAPVGTHEVTQYIPLSPGNAVVHPFHLSASVIPLLNSAVAHSSKTKIFTLSNSEQIHLQLKFWYKN